MTVQPQETAGLPIAEAGVVPCLRCGYDLRGLQPQGRCPECGRAVGRSVRTRPLSACSAAHLRRLGRGLDRVVLGGLMVPGGVLLSLLGSAVVGGLVGYASATPPAARSGLLASADTNAPLALVLVTLTTTLITLTGAALLASGWWAAASRDPRPREHRADRRAPLARMATRWLSLAAMAVFFAAFAAKAVQGILEGQTSFLTGRSDATHAMVVASAGLLLTAFASSLVYLRHLGERARAYRVVRRAMRLLVWLGPLAIGCFMVLVATSLAISGGEVTDAMAAVGGQPGAARPELAMAAGLMALALLTTIVLGAAVLQQFLSIVWQVRSAVNACRIGSAASGKARPGQSE